MATRTRTRHSKPLAGENIDTPRWEDARHWMSIYVDLLEFKRGILERVHHDITLLPPIAQVAATADVRIIEAQMLGYERRLELWNSRVLELKGLWLDPESRILKHKGREAVLTRREFQLLKFLLDHPHRYFSTSQILSQAWSDPALLPEEVRNYVRRLRLVLSAVDAPVDLINKPRRGYSLFFRD